MIPAAWLVSVIAMSSVPKKSSYVAVTTAVMPLIPDGSSGYGGVAISGNHVAASAAVM